MEKKAEVFQNYVNEHDAEAFEMAEVPDDEQHTVIFRSHLRVDGQQLPVVVILDQSVFSMVRVQISPNCRTDENELAVLRAANVKNLGYKPFKLYFDPDGSLLLDSCLLTRDEGDGYAHLGDQIYTLLGSISDFLNGNYRDIMKEIWG